MFKPINPIPKYNEFESRGEIEYVVIDKLTGFDLSVYVDSFKVEFYSNGVLINEDELHKYGITSDWVSEVQGIFKTIKKDLPYGIMEEEYIISIQLYGKVTEQKEETLSKENWILFCVLITTNEKTFFVRHGYILNIFFKNNIKTNCLPILCEADYATCLEYALERLNSTDNPKGFIIKCAYSTLYQNMSITQLNSSCLDNN